MVGSHQYTSIVRERKKNLVFWQIAGRSGETFLSLPRKIKERNIIMARPIKETPILFGEDARRFEERMKQKRTESPKARERRLANYRLIMSVFKK